MLQFFSIFFYKHFSNSNRKDISMEMNLQISLFIFLIPLFLTALTDSGNSNAKESGNDVGVSKDSTEAVKWLLQAAEQGHAKAQFELGLLYGMGEGIPQDTEEAVKWYRQAAEQGYAKAQFVLGLLYGMGDERIPQDTEEAVKWYRKAAEQGLDQAQFILGLCYREGEGIPKDSTEAVKWLRQAAEQGNEDAIKALNKLGELGIK
jgi:TPR repeat protein